MNPADYSPEQQATPSDYTPDEIGLLGKVNAFITWATDQRQLSEVLMTIYQLVLADIRAEMMLRGLDVQGADALYEKVYLSTFAGKVQHRRFICEKDYYTFASTREVRGQELGALLFERACINNNLVGQATERGLDPAELSIVYNERQRPLRQSSQRPNSLGGLTQMALDQMEDIRKRNREAQNFLRIISDYESSLDTRTEDEVLDDLDADLQDLGIDLD